MALAEPDQAGKASDTLVRFGTAEMDAAPTILSAGPLEISLANGAVQKVRIAGTEVVRGIDMPVRDANWATYSTRTLDETIDRDGRGFTYRRTFEVADGLFAATFTVTGEEVTGKDASGTDAPLSLVATLELVAARPASVNRAGFVVLHPLKGVVGTPLERTRPDGRRETLEFPAAVSPGQPVFDIAALSHEVDGVGVTMTFEGDVFEMEDQRNWTDASFKTYCRPLGLPRPFDIEQGERITQRIAMTFVPAQAAAGTDKGGEAATGGAAPDIELAIDDEIARLNPAQAAVLARIPFAAAQVRVRPETASATLEAAVPPGLPVALEVVLPGDGDPADALAGVVEAVRGARAGPARALVLPAPYLASHQPEGPWPQGTTPPEATAAARAAFPAAEIVAGMLTNFTEFNRCPPTHLSDSVSFGTTAIVHAADDLSVLETLEALPSVFGTAKFYAGERPVRLGLTTIGMRSNPYGSRVADNPGRGRIAMAMDDPRHGALFGAAFLVGLAANAARCGIASLAPAMGCGPLGLVSEDARKVVPLFHVVRGLALLSGAAVRTLGETPGGLVTLVADRPGLTGIAANLGSQPATLAHGRAALLGAQGAVAAIHDPDWLEHAPRQAAPLTLAPLDVAFLFGDGDAL